jgi:hypothetical protein
MRRLKGFPDGSRISGPMRGIAQEKQTVNEEEHGYDFDGNEMNENNLVAIAVARAAAAVEIRGQVRSNDDYRSLRFGFNINENVPEDSFFENGRQLRRPRPHPGEDLMSFDFDAFVGSGNNRAPIVRGDVDVESSVGGFESVDYENPNPDAMTYEQLLELGERIGKVSRGYSVEDIEVITNL